MGIPQHKCPPRRPSVSPWSYIPCLESPEIPETTDRFRARALDACLETYLEYAVGGLENGYPLNQQETLHLVHHIKASGHFRYPRQIVWGTRPREQQCEHLSLHSIILIVAVDFNPEIEICPSWLVCVENVVNNIRFFDFFVVQTEHRQEFKIEGPQFDGPIESEVYIVVGEAPRRLTLVSIGKWVYAHELKAGLQEVLERVVGVSARLLPAPETSRTERSQTMGKEVEEPDDTTCADAEDDSGIAGV